MQPAMDEHSVFSSLLFADIDGNNYIFAGSTDEKLYQYVIQRNTSVQLIHTFDLASGDGTSTAITQMAISEDGLHLYALTNKRVIKHSVDVCNSFTSCDTCIGSGDPLCEWCIFESRCSREDCIEPEIRVSDEEGNCPSILSTNPSVVFTNHLPSGVEVQLSTSSIPSEQSYQCVYGFQTTVPVTRNGDLFTCSSLTVIPMIPENEDTLYSNVSLSHNDVIIATRPIPFTDCSVHTSCTSCIESTCGWCPFTFKCIPEVDQCGDKETQVNTMCPTLSPGNYYIHTNFTYEENPLVIQAQGLGNFTAQFQDRQFDCVIKHFGVELFRTRAELVLLPNGRNEVHCQQNRFDFNLPEASVEVSLNVEWNRITRSIDNPNNTAVVLYSCLRLGTNCARCFSIPDEFNCEFCESPFSCSLSSQCRSNTFQQLTDCPFPVISEFSPTTGPISGGTSVRVTGINLGADQSDIVSVHIGRVRCRITSYDPGLSLTCVTMDGQTQDRSFPVVIDFQLLGKNSTSSDRFHFLTPRVESFTPQIGPMAGGTIVNITGTHLDIGSQRSVTLAGSSCKVDTVTSNSILCITSNGSGSGVLSVTIDNWSDVTALEYTYEQDPVFISIQPKVSFEAGGTEFRVMGRRLHIVSQPRLLVYFVEEGAGLRRKRLTGQDGSSQDIESGYPDAKSEPCIPSLEGMSMTCMAPNVTLTGSNLTAVIGLELDGVSDLLMTNTVIVIHRNPRFREFSTQSFTKGEEIRLTIESVGPKFVFTVEMLSVVITPCRREEPCVCDDIQFTQGNTSFTCVASSSGLTTGSTLTVTARLGNYSQDVGRIEIEDGLNIAQILGPITALLAVGIIVFAVVVLLFYYRVKQKDHRYNELIMEMEKLESSVARECKLGFAELQTDLDELTGDVTGHKLPYHNIQVYLLANLFPGCKDHPVLHGVDLPPQRKLSSQRAIKDFRDLCLDKKVLLLFLRTFEEQRSFSIRDKSNVGSLLMVALHTRMEYATEFLKTLLSDLIVRTVSRSHPKLLLRRTESIAERMLSNWLAFCLYDHILEHTGKPMYLLYRAVKSQLEKGPIDVITGEARYSLSEHKLIRQKMDVEVINVTVETDDGLKIPVKVLDCDTISQAKEKMLDALFKSAPVSKRPTLTTVDLEYIKPSGDTTLLRDEDHTTGTEGGWKQINTLQHYTIPDGATFRLVARAHQPPPGKSFDYPASLISSHGARNRALSEADDGTRVWHLFKQHDAEDPRRSPFLNKKMITEVYLPRMLSTKNILQKFVDDLFTSLFSVSQLPTSPTPPFSPQANGTQIHHAPISYSPGSHVPKAVKYILDFLDDSAKSAQISDSDVVHTWKNNALALRFWVNMIKNPEFVFDINKSHTVDACLSVIAQAFIDGCSSADVKLNIDSPTSKLLYNKEVQGYKTQVRQYYEDVARLPRVSENEMQSYLKQLSAYQSQRLNKHGGFAVESALFELLRYCHKYQEQLLTNLRAAGLEAKARVFESVLRVTDM